MFFLFLRFLLFNTIFRTVSDHKATFPAQVGHVIVGGIFEAGGLVMISPK